MTSNEKIEELLERVGALEAQRDRLLYPKSSPALPLDCSPASLGIKLERPAVK